MKAAVLHGNEDIRYEEFPTPETLPGTVKVRVRATGICGSDVGIYHGTNAAATAAMLKAGASAGATGENAVVWNAGRAQVIAGPIGLVMANSMLGECSPAMAAAVAESPAHKVLIPTSRCGASVAGLPELPLADYIADAARRILEFV